MSIFSKPTVFIGKQHLVIYSGTEVQTLPFSENEIPQIFQTVKDQGLTELQILLSPHYTYTLGMDFGITENLRRDVVHNALQYKIPEVFEDRHFDWSLQATDDEFSYVQASVIKPGFFQQLFPTLSQLGISYVYNKPLESILQRAVETAGLEDVASYVLCVADPEPIFLYQSQNTIWFSGLYTNLSLSFSDFISFAESQNLPVPAQMFYDSAFAASQFAQRFFTTIPDSIMKQQVELDIVAAANHFSAEKGKDKNVLSFSLLQSNRSFLLFGSLFLTIMVLFLFVAAVVGTVLFLP